MVAKFGWWPKRQSETGEPLKTKYGGVYVSSMNQRETGEGDITKR